MTGVLIKEEICTQRYTHREHNVKIKAETGEIHLRGKEHQTLPTKRRKLPEMNVLDSPSKPSAGTNPANT